MKHFCKIAMVVAIATLSVGCTSNSIHSDGGVLKQYLHNSSTEEVTIVTPIGFESNAYDSVLLIPDAYYLLEGYAIVNERPNAESLHRFAPLYIYYNGIRYQIDRNDMSGCLWASSYRPATSEENKKFTIQENKDIMYVFDLTEEYIAAQMRLK